MGASTLGCSTTVPGGEAGALCNRDLWNKPWGVDGPVGPSEIGPGCIFPGGARQDCWPDTNRLMLPGGGEVGGEGRGR